MIIDGELVQQPNPEKVYTGEGGDKIGPGHYEVKREITDKKKGTNWHVSHVKRLEAPLNKTTAETSTLGPGSYDPVKPLSIQQTKLRGSSSFVSKVPKVGRPGVSQGGNRGEEQEEVSESEEEDEEIEVIISF